MSRLADTREWTDPRGWDLPPHLALRISEPASNVVRLRVADHRPHFYDWAKEADND